MEESIKAGVVQICGWVQDDDEARNNITRCRGINLCPSPGSQQPNVTGNRFPCVRTMLPVCSHLIPAERGTERTAGARSDLNQKA